MKFKLRSMEVFRAVMVSGSVNGAARLLHTSQPSLSKSIAHLEQTLGLALFTRTKSSLIATKEAHILFAEISKLYDSALQIDDLVDRLKTGQRGLLSVATSPSFALTLMPQAIKLFRARRPDSQIHCRSITVGDAGNEILGKKSELVISTLPIDHPHLTCQEQFSSQVVCLIPKGHPLERFDTVELAQIARHPVISYDRETMFGKLVAEAFEAHGLTLDIPISVARTEQACALVQAGIGISLGSAFSSGAGVWSNVVARPIAPAIRLPVIAIHSSFEKLSAQASEFLESLQSAATTLQASTILRHPDAAGPSSRPT